MRVLVLLCVVCSITYSHAWGLNLADIFNSFFLDVQTQLERVIPGLAMSSCLLDNELARDVVHFSTLSVRSDIKEYPFLPYDLSQNEIGVEPLFPNHGQTRSVYVYLPISGRKRGCFKPIGALAQYGAGYEVDSYDFGTGEATWKQTDFVKREWYAAKKWTTVLSQWNNARMVVCLRDPESSGDNDNLLGGNVLSYYILMQGGRRRDCLGCNPALKGTQNVAKEASSEFVNAAYNPQFVVSDYIPLTITRQTDDAGAQSSKYSRPPSASVLDAWYHGANGLYGTQTATGLSKKEHVRDCRANWRLLSSSVWRSVGETPEEDIPIESDIVIAWECHMGRQVFNNPTRSPFSRAFANSGMVDMPVACGISLDNHYDIYCSDPQQGDAFATWALTQEPNPAEVTKKFLRRETIDPVFPSGNAAIRDRWKTLKLMRRNRLQYQSANFAMKPFMELYRVMSPTVYGYTQWGPIPQNKCRTSIAFWRLFNEPFSNYVHSLIEPQISLDLSTTYNRAGITDYFERDCPAILDSNVPCNAKDDNENICVTGRCLCAPGWLGIGCHIAHPKHSNGKLYTVEEVIRASYNSFIQNGTDVYQICSTAGALMKTKDHTYYSTTGSPAVLTSSTLAALPYCVCRPGFEGTPDDLGYIEKLATIFQSTLVGRRLATRRGSTGNSCYSRSQYADTVMNRAFVDRSLITPMSLLDNCARTDGRIYTVSFPWQDHLYLHQCMIWGQNMTLPSLQVEFDVLGTVLGNTNDRYEELQVLFAPPNFNGIGTYFPPDINPLATGSIGTQCWDYAKNGINWFRENVNSNTPQFHGKVVKAMQWIRRDPRLDGLVPNATLYGGVLCRPCPDCNRSNSICTDNLPVTDVSTTYCHCNRNYCGRLCNAIMCPTVNGKICGFGTCTTTADTGRICSADSTTGSFAGLCVCQDGYSGANCTIPVCPVNPTTGELCSGLSKGRCNTVSKQCECSSGFGGSFCGRKSCPRDPISGLECSGVVIPGTSTSVCDTTVDPPVCNCYQTTPGIFSVGSRDVTLTEEGWPASVGYTLTTIYTNGRWGTACERTYAEVCQDSSGLWCSQPYTSNGQYASGRSPGYAGCYNRTCMLAGTSSAGQECRPSCQCTTEFTTKGDPYCRTSICGNTRCDHPSGLDTGKCDIACSVTGQSNLGVTCSVPSIAAVQSSIVVTANCICSIANSTYWAKSTGVTQSVDACDQEANDCYSGTKSPCNLNGQCLYNATSGRYSCNCNPGFTGSKCETPPACLTPSGGLCNDQWQFCMKYSESAPAVCACRRFVLRNASRLCTYDACTGTGGTVNADDTCSCPGGAAFFELQAYLPPTVDQTAIGCRKMCPIDNTTGVECGALEVTIDSVGRNVRRNRCSDLLNNAPVFRNTSTPSPACSCYFRGLDYRNKTNYFINSTTVAGACVPKCNPDGLCSGSECRGRGTLTTNNDCNCGPNWRGEFCDQVVCNKNPLIFDQTTCQCKQWCLGGSDCTTDLCATSGGVCAGSNPTDCDCSNNPYLTLDLSPTKTSQRQCVGKCRNGGYLNPTKSGCICPFPFFGDLCETAAECPLQFSGVYCNISNCLNGAVPRSLSSSGCDCSDSYYQGVLCQYDYCGVNGRTYRNASGSCVCYAGFTGQSCEISLCGNGGNWNQANLSCSCKIGYYLAANRTACILDPNFERDCVNGVFGILPDGSLVCVCNSGWSGQFCDISPCVSPEIPLYTFSDGTVICGCPASYGGTGCRQSLCRAHSTGSATNPSDNQTYCMCVDGYQTAVTADSQGVFQCEPLLDYCWPNGTVQLVYTNGFPTCVCKADHSGPTCYEELQIGNLDVILIDPSDTTDTQILSPLRSAILAVFVGLLFIVVYIYTVCMRKLNQIQTGVNSVVTDRSTDIK